MNNQELQHYGVKGMKWGVRRAHQEYEKLGRLKAAYKDARKNRGKSVTRAEYKTAKKAYKVQKKEVRKNTTLSQKLGNGAQKTKQTLNKIGSESVQVYTESKNKGKAWINEWIAD